VEQPDLLEFDEILQFSLQRVNDRQASREILEGFVRKGHGRSLDVRSQPHGGDLHESLDGGRGDPAGKDDIFQPPGLPPVFLKPLTISAQNKLNIVFRSFLQHFCGGDDRVNIVITPHGTEKTAHELIRIYSQLDQPAAFRHDLLRGISPLAITQRKNPVALPDLTAGVRQRPVQVAPGDGREAVRLPADSPGLPKKG